MHFLIFPSEARAIHRSRLGKEKKKERWERQSNWRRGRVHGRRSKQLSIRTASDSWLLGCASSDGRLVGWILRDAEVRCCVAGFGRLVYAVVWKKQTRGKKRWNVNPAGRCIHGP